MPIEVRVDDLSSPEVQALIAEHLAALRGNSPPGSVYALAIEGLKKPEITFWSDHTWGANSTDWRGGMTGAPEESRVPTAYRLLPTAYCLLPTASPASPIR